MANKTTGAPPRGVAGEAPPLGASPEAGVAGFTTTVDPESTAHGAAESARSMLPFAWCLTLVYHPRLSRIGGQFCWPSTPGETVGLSRLDPLFCPLDGGPAWALDEAQLSRSPLVLHNTPTGITVAPGSERVRYEIHGRLGGAREVLTLPQLQVGVLITLAGRVSLLLHTSDGPPHEAEDWGLLGVSDGVRRVRAEVGRLAGLHLPVLLTGESGVGKELVARAIHAAGPRRERRLVAVNMSALPASTAAAQLFGYGRGAYTGAAEARAGLFGDAEGGTLFLDEIGETPLELQPMLLRAIEQREIQPIGLPPRRVDVRLITATDADLHHMAGEGRFRSALLYRVAATTLVVPPLRARRVDVPVLLMAFLRDALAELGAADRLRQEDEPWLRRRDVLALLRYPWPGNVRELRNFAHQLAVASHQAPQAELPPAWQERLLAAMGGPPTPPAIALAAPGEDPAPGERSRVVRLDGLDAGALTQVLERNGWQVGEAARELGVSRTALYAWMRRLELRHAGTLSREEILEARRRVGADGAALAAALRVSERALSLRLKALGLESGQEDR